MGEWAQTQRGRVLTKVELPGHPRLRLALLVASGIGAVAALALIIQFMLFHPFYIPSASMEPTLKVGDRVLVREHPSAFRRGEVVVFHSSLNGSEDLIKRVVAVAGDTVEVRGGALYVNGLRQAERYLLQPVIEGVFPKTKIRPGFLFVMGDNRNDSEDSRIFGQVPTNTVIGQAYVVYWPLWHVRRL